ncbi:MAG TPA: DUF2272 domain-containing protein [Luteimonas sp.]|nr:DUF2272 domain-containing protein [Luteimonas sp.]
MYMVRVRCLVFAIRSLAALLLVAANASAAEPCIATAQASASSLAGRIAAIACQENALWYRPFIDIDGRLASMTVAEAETLRLGDRITPAWKRVADYWRGSGLLSRMTSFPGASECAYASNDGYPSPACRSFLVDRPWSAAFVSYVMVQAGVPGFRVSPSHIDYVRDAYQYPESSPFRFADPDAEKPAPGDMLCFVRGASSVVGYAGLKAFLDAASGSGLAMHCDIVVTASPGDGRLYEIGGNVLQGVTLRTLNLNRNGMLWALPRGSDAGCTPGNEAACSFNRQNWAVLLKLRPLAPSAHPLGVPTPAPASPACCVNCVVGADPPVPRCKGDPGTNLPGS